MQPDRVVEGLGVAEYRFEKPAQTGSSPVLVPGSRLSRGVPAAEGTEGLARSRQPSGLDALASSWWAALRAAQSALQAAAPYLGAQELGEHSRRLIDERGQAVQLLRELAHDLDADSRLIDWLATPTITGQMLGLPAAVIACVFDLDGVLTTSASAHAAAWEETLDPFLLERAERSHRQFIPFDRQRDYQDHIAGKPRLDGVRAFLASRGIGLPEGDPEDPPGDKTVYGLANRKNRALQYRLDRQGVAAFQGSRSYLEAGRMLGLRCAVVSPSANTATILERSGLAHLIEQRIDGNNIEAEHLRPKPAPDTLLAACQRLHVQPNQTAAFETTPAGITAARTAGVNLAIGVDRSGNTEALRASDADLVITDLAELLRA